jgi:hypothetical protein
MYTTYGESTKSSSNAYIGAFGIGAKSPFAYTDSFNVTAYQNGKGRAYSMFVEDGAPQMTLMGEFETDEPSGLEVFFPVRLSDVWEFQVRAVRILAFMADKLEVKGVPGRWHEELDIEIKRYEWTDAPYIGPGCQTSHVILDNNYSSLHIVQGNVAYEMSAGDAFEILKLAIGDDYDRTARYLETNFYLSGFIRVPNGTFVPHPSRERLTLDGRTKEGLKDIFSKVFKHFICDEIDFILGSVKTYYELYLALLGKSRIIRNSPQVMDFIAGDQSKHFYSTLTGRPILNFGDWRKSEFSGVTVAESPSGGHRFKRAGHLTMTGSLAKRIYFTNKYPLSADCRYRLINAMRKSEVNNVIILDAGYPGRLFQPSDKALFIDVQALPKLTQSEWDYFKNSPQVPAAGARVTKEEVSLVTIDNIYKYAVLKQVTANTVPDIASKMRVMWVGSNHRYEFPLGDRVYKLKVKGDCGSLYKITEFYLNPAKDMIPNYKEGDIIQFGIAVLSEGHLLRSRLPELSEVLRQAALLEIREFLKVPRFQVQQSSWDIFIERLKRNPLVFDKLLEGWSERGAFDKWRAAGMPKGAMRINKPFIPFHLWDDSDAEMKDARNLYEAEQNCVKVNVGDFYEWISTKSPLFEYGYSRGGVSNETMAEEFIEYMKFKLGIKSNE